MGAVSALRETGVVFAALLGAIFVGRALDRLADRRVLHHRPGRGLRRLAILTAGAPNENAPAQPGRFRHFALG